MIQLNHDTSVRRKSGEVVIVRTFTADTLQEARTVRAEHGGESELIHNGTKHVWRVRTIKKQA